VTVDRRQALDTLEVEVEVTDEQRALLDDLDRLATLRAAVNTRLDQALGISTDVVLHPPGTLPRSEGKAQRVFDKRAPYV